MAFRGSRLLPLVFGLLIPAALAAQAVEIRLLDNSTRAPVAGAIVRLLGDGGAVAQGLTDELGRIVLRAPGPGQFRIRTDRIGWSGTVTDPFALASGDLVRRVLVLPSQRVVLPVLEVRGRSDCAAEGQAGTLAAVLWDEIRKALTANLITQQGEAVALHLRTFVREADPAGKVLREWVNGSAIVRGRPFTSLPPSMLARAGFVQRIGDSVQYAAPDAALLLSDEFVAGHCFTAVPGGAQGKSVVGLAFEPAGKRRVPDVKGTLWVDRESSELRFLEYTYTGLPEELAPARLGGRVEFRRLPSGAWIVGYWHIRMPNLDSAVVRGVGNTRQSILRLMGYIEQGGRAEVAARTRQPDALAIVYGLIYDSTTSSGLAGAVVRVQGLRDSALSDREGRFRLAVAASGEKVVTVSHPRLSLLGAPASRQLLLSLEDSAAVSFAVPGVATFARAFCGGRGHRSGLVGIAWGFSAIPSEGLTVRASWLDVNGTVRAAQERSGPRGTYALCDLPPGPSLTVRLLDRTQPFLERRVRLQPGEFRWVELSATPESAPDVSGAPRAVAAVLTGIVRQDSTGRPLPGVEVVIEGPPQHTETDDSGRYVLSPLPAGRHVALFRAVGFRPSRIWVGLVPTDTVWADAALVPAVLHLEPIEVKSPGRVLTGLEAIEERKRLGFGRFIDSTELRHWEHLTLGELLIRKGVNVWKGQFAASRGRVGLDGTALCYMQIIVDGVLLFRSPTPNAAIMPNDPPPPNLKTDFDVANLEAVEVYQGAAETPAEFNGSGAGCGTVVLWTRHQ